MKSDQALVPTLWWFELRNALVVNERRGRITEQQTARFLRNVERLAITIDGTPDESGVLTLGAATGLPCTMLPILNWR